MVAVPVQISKGSRMTVFKNLLFAGVVAAGSVFALAGAANAAPITTIKFFAEGNDCNGGSFESCSADINGVYPNGTGPDGASPTVYKLNRGTDGNPDTEAFGGFASIDGTEFDIDLGEDSVTFTYNPDADDPVVNFAVIKTGRGGRTGTAGFFLIYNLEGSDLVPFEDGTAYSFDKDFLLANALNAPTTTGGFSHISFFDTENDNKVPAPAALSLLGLGLLGLGAVARRRKSV